MEIVIGIDLGTQGVRCIATNQVGTIAAIAEEKIQPATSALADGWVEQSPHDWWQATIRCLRALMTRIPHTAHVVALSVDSTSGTVLPIDANGEPLHAALMYNDSRSAPYVQQVREAAVELEQQLGYAFNASFALPKLMWMQHELPDIHARTNKYIHAADFIVGRLCGTYGITDYSNALKTGYDLVNNRWPAFITDQLGLPITLLPEVIAPGQPVGKVSSHVHDETGLPVGALVVTGATDGTAAQIASGAVQPGAWNSSLGTTLVIKGITQQLLHDPLQRIYSHRHPEGWWMPGGASNTGCEWIIRQYAGADLKKLDAIAQTQLPTSLIRYPLARTGERFPFLRPQAIGFAVDRNGVDVPSHHDEYFAAGLEGTAMLERLAYETLIDIGASIGDRIHVTGGGSKSMVWLQLRANILGHQLIRPLITETAMGTALLAASGIWYHSLSEAAVAMVKSDVAVDPQNALQQLYNDKHACFRAALAQREYIADR